MNLTSFSASIEKKNYFALLWLQSSVVITIYYLFTNNKEKLFVHLHSCSSPITKKLHRKEMKRKKIKRTSSTAVEIISSGFECVVAIIKFSFSQKLKSIRHYSFDWNIIYYIACRWGVARHVIHLHFASVFFSFQF